MTALQRLRRTAEWVARTLEVSTTGCYAVAEFAAPRAELQIHLNHTSAPSRRLR